eukprot:SAG31_NODE_6129_length_2156_cov_3.983957_1_plen_659_part_01
MLLLPLGRTGQGARRAFLRRCNRFLAGQFEALWEERPVARVRRQGGGRSGAGPDLDAVVRAVRCGRPSKACSLLMSHGVCEDHEAALGFLRSVHFEPPAEDPGALTPEEEADYQRLRAAPMPPEQLALLRASVQKLLPSLPSGVSAGPTGLRYEHLRALADSEAGHVAVVEIVCMVATGADLGVADARLTALLKGAEVADGLRPVASGEVLRRVAGRALMGLHKAACEKELLRAGQLALTSDSCVVGFNLVREHLAQNPGHAAIKTDKSAAFQRKSRARMARWLMRVAPGMLPLFHALYGHAATLTYGADALRSEHGCQQGCPLGMLLFCAGEADTMQELIERHPRVVFVCYADDVFILGDPADAAAAFEDWAACTAAAEEIPNFAKCELYAASAAAMETASALLPPLVKRSPDGIGVLGFPLGTADFVAEFLLGKAMVTASIVDRLLLLMLHHANSLALQSAYLILRYCAEPRIAHLLRAMPPGVLGECIRVHDGAIARGLGALLGPGNALDLGAGGAQLVTADQGAQLALRQARMPIREGGLGLTAAADVCRGAYIGGWAGTMRSMGAMPAHASFPPHLRADALGDRLQDSDDEHCAELRGAWTEVESELRAAPEPVDIAELVGTGLGNLSVSHRMAQKQLAHGLAAARALRLREAA